MKNAHGTGSIRKRSDGRWEGRYTAPNGTQHSVYGRTKQAAIDALKRKQAEMTTGTYIEPSKTTVGQWLTVWINEYKKDIKPTTRRNYESYINNYFLPNIGNIRLSQLKALHIQRMFNALTDSLSANSLKAIKIALSSALATAVKFDLIQSNPCSKVTLSKPQTKEMHIIDRDQFPAFITAANATKFPEPILFLIQTGLRIGELRGLRWEDIDFQGGTMHICRQISKYKQEYIIQTPKNGKPRSVVLIDETKDLLKRYKIKQKEMQLHSKTWADDELSAGLVFRLPSGQHFKEQTLRSSIAQIGKQLGIPELHVHDLRHSYAVAALRSGINVKTVQNNLGHSSASMTLDIYAKYTDDMGHEAAEKLGAYWRENSTV